MVDSVTDDDLLLERVRGIYLGLARVEEVLQWQRPIFKVDGIVFAGYGGDSDFPFCVVFRPEPSRVPELLARPEIFASPQLDNGRWLGCDLANANTDWSLVTGLVEFSYAEASK